MIGSMTEASEILAVFRANDDVWYPEIPVPDGWKYIGHGMYRCAFLSPTGVVYKIEKMPGECWGQSNRGEFERITAFRRPVYTESVIIPEASIYDVDGIDVIAMEYMSGEWSSPCHTLENCDCGDRFGGTCAMTQFLNLELQLGLNDVHSGNAVFIPAQKKWALVDLGA